MVWNQHSSLLMVYNKITVLAEHEEAVCHKLCWLMKFSYSLNYILNFLNWAPFPWWIKLTLNMILCMEDKDYKVNEISQKSLMNIFFKDLRKTVKKVEWMRTTIVFHISN